MPLRTALVSTVRAGVLAIDGWSNMIRPHEINLHDALTAQLPDLRDPTLPSMAFASVYRPITTSILPRDSRRPAPPTPCCTTSPFQLMGQGT